jgi:DNA-binding response OmpR family regulator
LDYLRVVGKHKFVLLVSAQSGAEVGAALLNAGADFWLPFDAEPQLIASVVYAAKRRDATQAAPSSWRTTAPGERPESQQESLGFALEPTRQTIRIGSHSAQLRGAEFRICQYLLLHRERWVLDAELRSAVLHTGTHSSESLVRVHVHQIRRALGHYHRCLMSRRRLGYRFVLQAANAE